MFLQNLLRWWTTQDYVIPSLLDTLQMQQAGSDTMDGGTASKFTIFSLRDYTWSSRLLQTARPQISRF